MTTSRERRTLHGRHGSAGAFLGLVLLATGPTGCGEMGLDDLGLEVASPDVNVTNIVEDTDSSKINPVEPSPPGTDGPGIFPVPPEDVSPPPIPRPVPPEETPPLPASWTIESDFSAGIDGWTLQGGVFSSPTPAQWNEGPGTISGTGEGPWYFHAPDRFLGDVSPAYGGVLKLRYLRQTSCRDSGAPSYFVILVGGGYQIAYYDGDKRKGEGTILTPFTLRLDASAPWYNSETEARASEAEIRAVLADLEMLQIYGQRDNCAGTTTLEYVRFAAP